MPLKNTFLEITFQQGAIVRILSSETGAIVQGKTQLPEFSLIVRDRVTPENATTYSEPGVQSRLRHPGADGYNPLQGIPTEFLSCEENETCVNARYRCGQWNFLLQYTLEKRTISVRLKLQYCGKEPIYLSEAGFSLPVFRFEGTLCAEQRLVLFDLRNHSCELDTPLDVPACMLDDFDHLPSLPHVMGAMDHDFHHEIDFLISRRNDRLFGWGHEENGTTLCYTFRKTPEGLCFSPFFWCFDRMESKKEMDCGYFTLSYFSTTDDVLEDACNAIKCQCGFVTVQTEEITSGCIYQKHGFIADGGGLKEELKELPYLKTMGITVVYLQPLSPPEAYLNDIATPVAACFGGAEALTAYTAEAHRLGMTVIADMVLHSVYRDSACYREHPEFIRRDETGGEVAYSIGTMTAEITDPGFQAMYEKLCCFLVEVCGLDGFRFDVAGFQLPGWQSPVPGIRPGMTVAVQSAVLKKLYSTLSRIKPILFLEEGMGVCGLRYISHGILPFLRFIKEPEPALLPEVLRRLAKLQQYHFLKDRPGVQTMLHVKIHDTILAHFGRSLIGGDLALLRYVLLNEGVPFLTDRIECGVREEITQLLSLRRLCPELGRGKTDFAAVQCSDPCVMVFLRTCGKERTLVCINFSRELRRAEIRAAGTLAEGNVLYQSEGSRFVGNGTFLLMENGAVVLKIAGEVVPPMAQTGKPATPHIPWGSLSFSCRWEDATFPVASYRSTRSRKLDEGSFSTEEKLEEASDVVSSTEQDWLMPDFDDSNWSPAFFPSTRQPCAFSRESVDAPYFEDRLKWAQNLLWSRDISLRNDSLARFRVHFDYDGPGEALALQCFSPSIYDFDLLLKCRGDIRRFGAERNAVTCFINGQLLVQEEKREYRDRIQIPKKALRKGENVIAIAVRRGFGGHGCCLKLSCGKKNMAVKILAAPCRSENLPFVSPEPGMIFTLSSAQKRNGFTALFCQLPGAIGCVLRGINGRIFAECGNQVPSRVNAYSGAEIPLFRSDEMLSEGERFSFICGGWEFACLSKEAVGMYFVRPQGGQLVFCIRDTPLQLRVSEVKNES